MPAVIDRLLKSDPAFRAYVAAAAESLGPPPGPGVIDDSGYFTHREAEELIEAGDIRGAAVLVAGLAEANNRHH